MDISKLLAGIETALGVVKQVSEIPGADLIPYVSTIKTVIGAVQAGIKLGKDVAPDVEDFIETFSGKIPTVEELAELNTRIADRQAKLHAPIPAREDGEPE